MSPCDRSLEKVVQTAWERRHPCLLATVSRSLPGTPQAKMPALQGCSSQVICHYSFDAFFWEDLANCQFALPVLRRMMK